MTATPVPRLPSGLSPAGEALWERVTGAYDLLEHELAILETACHQADDVAALEALIARDGLTVPGSAGQPRLNAAVAEVRQGRLALGKLLGQLALPDEDDRPMTANSARARKAADARWNRERRRREARASGTA